MTQSESVPGVKNPPQKPLGAQCARDLHGQHWSLTSLSLDAHILQSYAIFIWVICWCFFTLPHSLFLFFDFFVCVCVWQEYTHKSWRMKELLPLSGPQMPVLNPTEHSATLCFVVSNLTRSHLRLSKSSVMLVQIWERIPRTSSIVSLEACPDIVTHAYKHLQSTEHHF